MNPAVRAAYADLEHAQFGADSEERERLAELLKLTRAQMADDTASNDRARFGGQRTLSLDRFAESGFEPQSTEPRFSEEQEALEEGMRPFLEQLPMDEADATRSIFRYGFSYRDSARRLDITAPALQRRIARALKHLKEALLAASTREVEGG